MKKILFLILSVIIITNINYVFAIEDEFQFSLNYDGTITENVEKSGTVSLSGTNAPIHTNVRIKVDLAGPATPKLLATDSNGNELDIATIGYWGPDAGFTVGGTFTNVTPIKATYPEAGTYTTTLTLIDVNDPTAEYAKRTFTVNVEKKSEVNNENTNNNQNTNSGEGTKEELNDGDEEQEQITTLPQTGNYNIFYVAIPAIPIIGFLLYKFGFLRRRHK